MNDSFQRIMRLLTIIILLAAFECLGQNPDSRLQASMIRVLIQATDKIKDPNSARKAALSYFGSRHPTMAPHYYYTSEVTITKSPTVIPNKLDRGDAVWTVEVLDQAVSEIYPPPEAIYWIRAKDGAVYELAPKQ